jgi:hypothetical protein
MIAKTLLLAAAGFALAGCGIHVDNNTGPLEHDNVHIDLGKAELVKVELKMGAGEMKVAGGAQKLMDADFSYNVTTFKPSVNYSDTGVRGYLTVEQKGSTSIHGHMKNIWDIRLNDSVPMDLVVHFGAGEGRMDLGKLSLRSVDINMGVGEMKIDLRGTPKRDYNVHMRGGVGEATVYLPKDVGVMATASGGIGGIKVTGLHKEGGHYVNDAYEKSKIKVNVDVQGGVGSINLIGE